MVRLTLRSCLVLLAFAALLIPAPAQNPSAGADAKDVNALVDKAIAYLKKSQAEDGTWSKGTSPGITPVVVVALLRTGKVAPNDPAIVKALKSIEDMADPDTGALAGKGGKARLQNYLTSVNVAAMLDSDPKKYASLTEKAVKFLKEQPFDEANSKTDPKDPNYGGYGYDANTRPDMSNTIFALEALRTAKVPADDPVWKKVLVYVSRSQSLKSEYNDQAWAAKLNDGSFNYGSGKAGQKKGSGPEDTRPGYGSITCSGLVALMDCGVKKEDVRFKKALEWIEKEYTMDANPGTGGDRGYYLYLRMLAIGLDRAGIDTVTDGAKKERNWRADIVAALKSRQREDGAWVNKIPAWMEANPDLATAWALTALSHCKPASK